MQSAVFKGQRRFAGPNMDQKVEPLAPDDVVHIERQRAWVRGHYEPDAQHHYGSVEGKLRLLDGILRSNFIAPSETWKLQSLGITFGDALAQQIGLSWVAIEDEHGRDPALQYANTSLIVFPLTMISKRVERGDSFDVYELFEGICQTIAHAKSELDEP
jgi:hypothetical protein